MREALAMLAGAVALAVAGSASAQALDDRKANDLMVKAGCNACHAVDKKGVGPSYKDVAAKTRPKKDAAAQYLFDKVRKGGAGVYGQVPMPPNPPDKIGDADLKALVAWILTK
jgi:cytochrome c